jgi:hypothetical protein
MLKLVAVPNDTDDAYVTALANRRLMLAEVRRSPAPEPSAEALDAKYREWAQRVGGDPADHLARAGMTDAALRGWLRDDLRLDAYVADRFGGRSADRANWLGVLRQRAGLQ